MRPTPPIQDLHFTNAPDVDRVPGHRSQELLQKQMEIDSSAVAYPKSVPLAVEEAKEQRYGTSMGTRFSISSPVSAF